VPAVGYRIEYSGKVAIISGDTVAVSALLEQSRDADLLVSEVMSADFIRQMEAANRENGLTARANILHAILDYHMDVSDVGRLAEEAGVKRLALTHLIPPIIDKNEIDTRFIKPIQKIYHGEVIAGNDGTMIVIPLK
jgi:ribonuclease Z